MKRAKKKKKRLNKKLERHMTGSHAFPYKISVYIYIYICVCVCMYVCI